MNKLDKNDLKIIEELELIYFPNNNYNFQELNNFNESKSFEIKTVKEFKNIIGYCILFKSIDYLEIYKILVIKNYRNKKIASNIINQIKDKYKQKIIIEVSNKDNTIDFYKKNGFILIDIRKNYYSDNSDAYIMEYKNK